MRLFYLFFAFLLFSCESKTSEPISTTHLADKSDSSIVLAPPISIRKDSCICSAKSIQLAFDLDSSIDHWTHQSNLPDSGLFAQESHYVTNNDKFNNNELFASSNNENIDRHLFVSYQIYKDFDAAITLEKLYTQKWQKEWTPAESGQIGQGSIGPIQAKILSPNDELWLLTMMWAKGERPEPNTKFLVEANGKAVVVVAGYETGPRYKDYLGGLTPEVHYWLGTNAQSSIKISYLQNQNLNSGPIVCLK